MRYFTLRPSPALADVVDQYWAYEGYQPPYAFERIFPTGTVEILLNLQDGQLRCLDRDSGRPCGQWRGLLVAGVHQRHQWVGTAQQHTMLGIALRPGGAWRLLGIPASELTGLHVPLEEVLGSWAARLTERLWDTNETRDRLQLLDDVLRMLPLKPVHPAVSWVADQLACHSDPARLSHLADEAGVSTRRLRDLFQREVGVSTKVFARIQRFQHTLARLRHDQRTDLGTLALDAGYADQPHMIREFKAHSGLTPSEFRSLHSTGLNRAPVDQQDQMCPLTGFPQFA